MNTHLIIFASFFVGSLAISPLSLAGGEESLPTHTNQINNCDYSNYIITDEGKCIDIFNSDANRFNAYEDKFFKALERVGVSLSYESCDSGILGRYLSRPNRMIICQNNRKDFNLYIETLAHESWHVVQDCAAGLNNYEMASIAANNSDLSRSILVSLKSSDWMTLKLYDSQALPYEAEAFLMEKYPDEVLEALDQCAVNL